MKLSYCFYLRLRFVIYFNLNLNFKSQTLICVLRTFLLKLKGVLGEILFCWKTCTCTTWLPSITSVRMCGAVMLLIHMPLWNALGLLRLYLSRSISSTRFDNSGPSVWNRYSRVRVLSCALFELTFFCNVGYAVSISINLCNRELIITST